MIKNKRGKAPIALGEILILVVATFAFAYLIYSSVGVVSGQTAPTIYTRSDGSQIVDYRTNRPLYPTPVETNAPLEVDSIFEVNTPTNNLFGQPPITASPTNIAGSSIPAQQWYSGQVGPQNPSPLPNPAAGNQIAEQAAQPPAPGTTPPPATDGTTPPPTPAAAAAAKPLSGLWNTVGNVYGFDETTTKGAKAGFLTDGGMMDGLVSSASWGATAYGAVQLLRFVGVKETIVNAASAALGAGVFAGRAASTIFHLGGGASFLIGAGVAIAVFLFMYKEEKNKIVRFECLPWDAPTGGRDCEKCNQQSILPCSEYQCRSLGQACDLVNKGTAEEKCVWINRNDVEPPIIQPWVEALTENHRYTPDNTINPPDRGVKIQNLNAVDGCVKAFTPLSFGVNLNEPAKCKLDYERKQEFEDMKFFFGGSSFLRYNHTQVLSLPGPTAINNATPIIQNDGSYTLFTKCMDANGNQNEASFVFKFCVEKGPDTTPPIIVSTSLINGMPVAYNTSSLPIEVYVNEPATCRWDFVDRVYDSMINEMSCSNGVFQMNARNTYTCRTTLTGLKNNELNKFYFRCKDQPSKPENDRYDNKQSYQFNVQGTSPLVITNVGPNGTLRDSTNVVKVDLTASTFGGYKEGKATCYYSETGDDDDYIEFFNTNSDDAKHSTELHLPQGDYNYFIKCLDLGGNSDKKEVSFRVESDNQAPAVVRIYHDESENKLVLVTNERAECSFSTSTCTFLYDDGVKFTVAGDENNMQFADWNVNGNYYIKCMDEFGNQPLPNLCNVIVRPFTVRAEGTPITGETS